ncbi:hypothetical protein DsansV1_C08g0078241 [Dioscorea sansibarensis]
MTWEETSDVGSGMTIFTNVGGYQGFLLTGSRPAWVVFCREQLQVHLQAENPRAKARPWRERNRILETQISVCFIWMLSSACCLFCVLSSCRISLKLGRCDGSIVAFTNVHNVNCNHGLIYVTSQVPLGATPLQIAYFAEKKIYPLILSAPVNCIALFFYCQVTSCLTML